MLSEIGEAAFAKVQAHLDDPAQKEAIQQAAFESALHGISTGTMTYQGDPLLPIMQEEVTARTSAYANLSSEEESKLLSLSSDHRRIISENDRKSKEEFLGKAPAINNPGVRMHSKYIAYAASLKH